MRLQRLCKKRRSLNEDDHRVVLIGMDEITEGRIDTMALSERLAIVADGANRRVGEVSQGSRKASGRLGPEASSWPASVDVSLRVAATGIAHHKCRRKR